MDRTTVLILCSFFVGLTGEITDRCLQAICHVATGCTAQNCTEEGACGFYNMHAPYYIDCGSPGEDFESCSMDKDCSETCVKKYMDRYGTYCTGGRTPTCKDYARIHHGGPLGCLISSTKDFWTRVEAVLS